MEVVFEWLGGLRRSQMHEVAWKHLALAAGDTFPVVRLAALTFVGIQSESLIIRQALMAVFRLWRPSWNKHGVMELKKAEAGIRTCECLRAPEIVE